MLKPPLALDHVERRLTRHAAFAVVEGHRSASSAAHVKHRLTEYLRIQQDEVEVFVHPGESFLVFFTRVENCSAALSEIHLPLRGLELKLIPWSRRVQASYAKFRFRACLCLEGIPHHAWSADTAAFLLSEGCLLDKVDDVSPTEKEAACLYVWVWAQDASRIPKSACLLVVEPEEITSPPRNFSELGISKPPTQRGPPSALSYSVLIHLDQLWDFTPPDAEMEPCFKFSPFSVVSGLDSPVSSEDEVPRKTSFLVLGWFGFRR
ncbi:hypothetical protein ABZP36_005528 [Zizania latifolia]